MFDTAQYRGERSLPYKNETSRELPRGDNFVVLLESSIKHPYDDVCN